MYGANGHSGVYYCSVEGLWKQMFWSELWFRRQWPRGVPVYPVIVLAREQNGIDLTCYFPAP